MKRVIYDLEDNYQRGKMMGDALIYYAHQGLREGLTQEEMEGDLLQVFRIKLEMARAQRTKGIS
jgi:hypothetical protein